MSYFERKPLRMISVDNTGFPRFGLFISGERDNIFPNLLVTFSRRW